MYENIKTKQNKQIRDAICSETLKKIKLFQGLCLLPLYYQCFQLNHGSLVRKLFPCSIIALRLHRATQTQMWKEMGGWREEKAGKKREGEGREGEDEKGMGGEEKREGQSRAPWFSRMLYCFHFLALPINSGTWLFLAALYFPSQMVWKTLASDFLAPLSHFLSSQLI